MTLEAWVVDDDTSIRWVLERALGNAGMSVRSFPGGIEMLEALGEAQPDVVISDVRMRGIDGIELLQRIHAVKADLPIIIMTAHSDLSSAVAAYQGGAFEYLPKPFDVDDAVALVQRAARISDAGGRAEPAAGDKPGPRIIGEAPAMQEVFRAIGRLSRSQITVLITGESGTGKELVAQSLHAHSPRASQPFIAINTAAIPKELMESEFFGHERGAFTGASAQRQGRFEQADGGTLFLDEIGEMPADLQTRLLRVLADGQFYRVGGHVPIQVDVRVVAATNQDLERAVEEGRFREDLFHRLNVIRIRVPSLRERTEDVPLLLRHHLQRCAQELGTEAKELRPEVMRLLATLEWPGNVRQLENLCRWLTVMAPGRDIHLEDLPPELQGGAGAADDKRGAPMASMAIDGWLGQLEAWAREQLESGQDGLLNQASDDLERCLIRVALERSGGRRQDAAQLLGCGRNTLTRKIKELGIRG